MHPTNIVVIYTNMIYNKTLYNRYVNELTCLSLSTTFIILARIMKNNKILSEIQHGKIRTWSHIMMKFLRKYIPHNLIGGYYQLLHNIIIFGGAIVLLFTTNVGYLTACLIMVSLDAFANVVCHDCPLTRLERKYLKRSLAHDRKKIIKECNILYKCDHVFESQVELIVNVWTLLACKIVVLIMLRTMTPSTIAFLTTG